jgi:predicted ATPase
MIRAILEEAKRRGVAVKVITLTGGPLAGKSTGLIRIAYDFVRRGWFVVSVPEAATIIRGAGFTAETGAITSYAGQRAMIRAGENLFIQMLVDAINAGHTKILIVRDRSSLDCAAYMDSYEEFVGLLHELGIDVSGLNPSDRTIFLDSLGVDNPELYGLLCSNNSARHEDAVEAAAANARLVQAYEHFGVQVVRIGNNWPDGIEGKNRAVVNELLTMVGEQPVQSQAAYAVKLDAESLARALGFDSTRRMRITQFYHDGWRYRETVGPDHARVYTATQKTRKSLADPVVRYKEERYTNSGEFFHMLRNAKQRGDVIVSKDRLFGFYGDVSDRRLVTLDHYDAGLLPTTGHYCRVEVDNPGPVSVPDFLAWHDTMEITGLLQHSDEGLATRAFVDPFA